LGGVWRRLGFGLLRQETAGDRTNKERSQKSDHRRRSLVDHRLVLHEIAPEDLQRLGLGDGETCGDRERAGRRGRADADYPDADAVLVGAS
jgi:hypothetical protein